MMDAVLAWLTCAWEVLRDLAIVLALAVGIFALI